MSPSKVISWTRLTARFSQPGSSLPECGTSDIVLTRAKRLMEAPSSTLKAYIPYIHALLVSCHSIRVQLKSLTGWGGRTRIVGELRGRLKQANTFGLHLPISSYCTTPERDIHLVGFSASIIAIWPQEMVFERRLIGRFRMYQTWNWTNYKQIIKKIIFWTMSFKISRDFATNQDLNKHGYKIIVE